jgi:outer membrane protein OmpA-like peptidoglycan-associated protein
VLRRGWPLVAAATSALLAVASCSGQDAAAPRGPSTSAGTPSSATTSAPAPAMAPVDGFSRLNLLPEPVAAQVVIDHSRDQPRSVRIEVVQAVTVGDATRVVLAWDEPVEGEDISPSYMRSNHERATPFEIGLRLYDPATGTVSEPLRTSSGDCLCSNNTGRYTDPQKQSLFWADFPAAASEQVTVLVGEQAPPLEAVPVSREQPLLDLTAAGELADWVGNPPPATVGEAAAGRVVVPVRRTVRTFGGAEDSQVGGNADVSLPADVLFAFDSSTLTAKAKTVLATAAPKLAAAAKGRRVQVVGHTDDQGTPDYNDRLSLQRARAVAAYLTPRLRSARIALAAVGKGESEHLVPNTTADGKPIEANRRRNRRVSFVFPRSDASRTTGIDAPQPLATMAAARTTSPSPEVEHPIATVLSSDGTVKVHVTRLQRSGDELWVQLSFTAAGERADWGANPPLLGPNPYGPNDTLANVAVVDTKAKAIATPLTYGGGQCLCSENQGSGLLLPQPLNLWAVFPAPAAATVTLRIPGAGQVADLPIT